MNEGLKTLKENGMGAQVLAFETWDPLSSGQTEKSVAEQ